MHDYGKLSRWFHGLGLLVHGLGIIVTTFVKGR